MLLYARFSVSLPIPVLTPMKRPSSVERACVQSPWRVALSSYQNMRERLNRFALGNKYLVWSIRDTLPARVKDAMLPGQIDSSQSVLPTYQGLRLSGHDYDVRTKRMLGLKNCGVGVVDFLGIQCTANEGNLREQQEESLILDWESIDDCDSLLFSMRNGTSFLDSP